MKRIAIIGAGACGMLLAGLLNEEFDVTLLEKNNKLGKKILASGNGKCNFTNNGNYNNKYNNEFAIDIVSRYNHKYLLEYFTKLGLMYREDDEHRVYPLSECSSTIVDVLKTKLKGVKILLDSKVKKIEDCDNGIRVYYNDTLDVFDFVVCTSGSSASNLGSEYAYNYLKDYGLSFVDVSSSLTPIKIDKDLSFISGVRVKCLVKLYRDNEFVYEEKGEVLFKEDYLSGIVIYNISSMINRDKNAKYEIKLDLLSDSINDIDGDSLVGVLHPKLIEFYKGYKIENFKDLSFKVISFKDIKEAQVASGGINIEEVNSDLSLKRNNKIYIGGEVLDCDGMCGGYNLQFAFSCAFVINESLLKKTMK